ncbi:hypothetical protein [Amycolatopsis sp. CA-230715]|uniref:hypothetical protein n=1 Tax=Amycolatopsis sp. CA-230715 TaxID=2745196 RepID=UPI001C02DB38|nr:hypothetical protein [Amycolatopsis sp. CA-230715]QWF81004.1 hypothetical protein HUW46_04429 [Amycolatopsis sp. CA-230715]
MADYTLGCGHAQPFEDIDETYLDDSAVDSVLAPSHLWCRHCQRWSPVTAFTTDTPGTASDDTGTHAEEASTTVPIGTCVHKGQTR